MTAVGTATSIRASDAEREAVVARLHQALGEGRMDLAETDERVAAAYAATYREDLPPLLADIPAGAGAPAGAPQRAAVWTTIVWRARATLWGTDRAVAPPERPTSRPQLTLITGRTRRSTSPNAAAPSTPRSTGPGSRWSPKMITVEHCHGS